MNDLETSVMLEFALDQAKQGYRASQHMTNLLTPEGLKQHINVATDFLKKFKGEFDTIAFSGMSGAVLAPTIALKTGKHLIMVRKSDDKDNHRGLSVEGYQECKRYIIIDDLVASGSTVRRIKREIRDFAPEAVCLGALTVSSYSGLPEPVTTFLEVR